MPTKLSDLPARIGKILTDVFAVTLEDYDGHTKYHRKPSIFHRIFYRLFGIKNLKKDRRGYRAGQIKVNLLYYITAPMIIITLFVLYAVATSIETLLVYFQTNIFLNSIIVSLLIFGVLRTYYNAFLLHKSARFIRRLELMLMQDEITDANINKLHRMLDKPNMVLNTLSMFETIENIREFGHPNFNDHRARLIKSKLGFRVNKNKTNVSFIAGLLVMLGLLGTFLGLLGTIDAVGEAMNSMSNIGGDGGEVGAEEMTGFIGSLAAPLQGMGLAFSTSLFGLSGSLMIGFFLHLAGTPQNAFMEQVSRWIDDRVGQFNPDLTKKVKNAKPANEDNLKDWLTGFVHLSVKTNQKIANLSAAMKDYTHENAQMRAQIQELTTHQGAIRQSSENMDLNLRAITSQTQVISQGISENMPDISKNVASARHDLSGLSGTLSAGNAIIEGYIQEGQNHAATHVELATQIKALLGNLNDIQRHNQNLQAEHANDLKQQMKITLGNFEVLNGTMKQIRQLMAENQEKNSRQTIERAIVKFSETQEAMSYEIQRLLKRLNSDPNVKQSEALALQLNDLLSHMNKKAKDLLD